MNLGERIRTLRRQKQLTQKKLAELIGKEASFISHIERGARNVSVHLLHAIANGLEITPIEILSGGTNEFERCIQKISRLNEEGLRKTNEYVDFLLQAQIKKEGDRR
ncbi:MAG: helix-turn-helix transcriptional regulator [Candidatus Omnitrophica bacterium]|nr:helix-turn-helix transcriptional regulator [Candidatus Omnitrophota bacterium]